MNKTKKVLIVTLSLVAILSIFLTYKAYMNKPVMLDDIKYSENTINKKKFGIFVEKSSYSSESDKYEVYSGTTWPGEGYVFNSTLSMCFDNDGIAISNALSYNQGAINITTSKTAYCYVYFDISTGMTGLQLVASNPDNLSSSLVGGLNRYQGTYDVVDNNYICFGTDDEETCTNDTDHYMYRIIGVNSSGQIEVIKKEALNEGYKWHDDSVAYDERGNNVVMIANKNESNKVGLLYYTLDSAPAWPDSLIFGQINGNVFLDNTSYVPTIWKNKIATVSWKHGAGPNNSYDGDVCYQAYEGWTDSTNAKISLIYMHDYMYAYGSTAPGNSTNASNSWISLSKNDSAPPVATEWTNTINSTSGNGGLVDFIVQTKNYSDSKSIRPVFYLESTITLSGEGTISHPYIITN